MPDDTGLVSTQTIAQHYYFAFAAVFVLAVITSLAISQTMKDQQRATASSFQRQGLATAFGVCQIPSYAVGGSIRLSPDGHVMRARNVSSPAAQSNLGCVLNWIGTPTAVVDQLNQGVGTRVHRYSEGHYHYTWWMTVTQGTYAYVLNLTVEEIE
jgi:hypothetical protein